MNDASVEARLLKGLVQAVLDADFTAREAKAAAKSLRDNKLFAPVAHLLDVLGSATVAIDISANGPPKRAAPQNKSSSSGGGLSVDAVFDTVKRRKITKAQLFDIFFAVNRGATPELPDQVSVREALASFRWQASEDDWRTLVSIIDGKAELDPFLRGMLNR